MSLPTAEEAKACCAAAYGSDVVAMLLGDSYHPGGPALTRRLVAQLALPPRAEVLDIASGRGTTALLLARELGLRVHGVDLSPANVALARGAADAAGLDGRVTFTLADAERLPFPDKAFDGVVVECALCTFPDKAKAVAEMARVVRRGGRFGLADVVADPGRLPAELRTSIAYVACVAGAAPMDAYGALLQSAGWRVRHAERHDAALVGMIDQIEARLAVVRLTARAQAEALGLDLDRAPLLLAAARSAISSGALGYMFLVAERPARDRSSSSRSAP